MYYDEFIAFQHAFELKELGFDEPCVGKIYADGGVILLSYLYRNSDQVGEGTVCSAPLYQQAFKWFREVYRFEGIIQQSEDSTLYKWTLNQYNEDGKKYVADWFEFETYEEAEYDCLLQLINIAKTL